MNKLIWVFYYYELMISLLRYQFLRVYSKTMKSYENEQKDAFKKMYNLGVRASYFGQMSDPQAVRKSKLQISCIEQDAIKEVDEKTFRLYPNFKRPEENFSVQKRSGECYLDKPSFFSCFSRRKIYQIDLNNSRLCIHYKGEIARFVDFEAVSTKINNHKNCFSISFQGSDRQLSIEPVKSEDVQKWINILDEVRNNTEGKQKKRTYLARKTPEFFKFEHVLNEQFQKQANSGDILLFQSPHSAATAQRLFTNSQYDHVGIVLRNQRNQIFVYESTAAEGVGLTPWKHMIKYEWYNLTNKITWRQLNAQISPKQIKIIEAFVAKTLGKEFAINLDKLFQFKSTLKRSDQYEQAKTYFCSELAARLYKQLGYFDTQKASTTYYPVDFSQKVKLKFVKPGVSLSNEKIISFDM